MPTPVAPPGYTSTESGLLMPVDLRASHFGGTTTTQTPDPWLVDWFGGGGRSHAGVRVSPQGSLALAAYYACLNVIAQDCAKLPLPVLRELEHGREKVRDHPLWRILQHVFNRDMTAYIGRYVMTHHAVGWGNGYGYIVRDRSMTRTEGQVIGIYPIHPARVIPQRDQESGEIVYEVSNRFTTREPVEVPDVVPASDMIHLKGPSGDGLVGYTVAQIARETLGAALAAQQYGAEFFGHGGQPTGILTHPGKFKTEADIEKLKARWNAAGNGTRVLEEGLTWTSVTIPPEQAQFLETRAFGVLELCRLFRMQPHKIADLTNAHFTNIEHQSIEHIQDTMAPWHRMWEQELAMKLLAEDPALYVRHDVRALLQGDSKARAEYYRTMVMTGIYSPNIVLELEDMDPYDGGDERFMQIQMAPVRKIVDGTARQPRQAQRPVSPSDPGAHRNGHHHPEEHAYAG
jgi:HK97 family phage portal protein